MPGHRLILRPMSKREGHSPLAIHTAAFVHVLVLLAGLEMYTVSCATSSLLPLLRAPSSHRVGFGRCSTSTTSTTQRTSPFPQSSKASCLGIVSLEAHSQVSAAALCLCLSPGNDGAHMVHPLAWPTQLLGSPASPQRAGRWSPWTPEKGR